MTFIVPRKYIRPLLKKLKREMGEDYSIKCIDLEWCLYRDFGNGFDVEISNVNHHANSKQPATLYLWDTRESFYNAKVVKVIDGIDCTASALIAAVDSLYNTSQVLMRGESA